MNGLAETYRAAILAEFRNPANRGERAEGDFTGYARNRTCGDEVSIHLRRQGNVVGGARQEAEGCAITTAAASFLTRALEGLDEGTVKALLLTIDEVVAGREAPERLPEVLQPLAGVSPLENRHRCVQVVTEACRRAVSAWEGADAPR